MVELKYVDNLIFPGGAGSGVQFHAYRANSIFDPDAAVGGHQPMYMDQLALFYTTYSVLSSTITCKFTNSSFQPWVALLRVQDNTSQPTPPISAYMEQPNIYSRTVSMGQAVTMRRRWTCKGLDRSDNQGLLGGTITGTNPDIGQYFGIACCYQDPTSNFATGNPQVEVTIRYRVMLTDRIDVAQS